jgi:hypothetical protein
MANYSKKVMGKEVGDAKVYAEPHTMSGKKVTTAQSAVTKPGNGVDNINISVGGISKGNYKPENPYGVGVMRGYGAATKGRKISGKMG